MSNLVSELLAPGGGVKLIPAIRFVIGCLLLTTTITLALGVARIHMAILSFLSGGLLVSLKCFEVQYEKVKNAQPRATQTSTPGSIAKTD
mmetsp:Transcript_21589/g.30239  ORF Transcript_21589/g.30239 Transcript_21589/m.30239 type:complete len:90 (+) Transcript_21589:94-363(+)